MEDSTNVKTSISEWFQGVEKLHQEFVDQGKNFYRLNHEMEDAKKEMDRIGRNLEDEQKDQSEKELIEQELRTAKREYEEQIAKEKRGYQNRKQQIQSAISNRQNSEIQSYEKQKQSEINTQETKIASLENEKNSLQQAIFIVQKNLENEKNGLDALQSDEVQTEMIKESIREEYNKVASNSGFVSDYGDSRGATESEAESYFGRMSTDQITVVAKSMQDGHYASSPEEVRGIPIGEIFMMTFGVIYHVLLKIFSFIPKIYKPGNRFRKLTDRIFYYVAVTAGIVLLATLLINKVGDTVMFVLVGLLAALLVFAIVSFIINWVKVSNVEKRRLLNLEYYTVGYYFLKKPDVILGKIADSRFHWLRENRPDDLKKMTAGKIEAANMRIGKLNTEKEQYQKAYDDNCKMITDSQKEIERIAAEDNRGTIEQSCQQTLNEQLRANTENHKRSIEQFEKNYENLVNDIKQNAEVAKAKRAQRIKEMQENYENKVKEAEDKKNELEESRNQLNDLQKKSKEYERQFKEGVGTKGNPERNDSMNMQLPNNIFVGTGIEEVKDKYGRYEVITTRNIPMNNQPILIVLAGDQGLAESDKTTRNFYKMLDVMLYQLFDRMYYNAFSLHIFDGKEKNLKKNFFWIEEKLNLWDSFVEANCVVIGEEKNVDQFYEKLISTREKELDGKTVDQINERNKSSDNPARKILMAVRLYDEKSNFLKDLKANMKRCKDDEIVPIIFITKNSLDSLRQNDSFKVAMKEEFKNVYYELDVEREQKETPGNLSIGFTKQEYMETAN